MPPHRGLGSGGLDSESCMTSTPAKPTKRAATAAAPTNVTPIASKRTSKRAAVSPAAKRQRATKAAALAVAPSDSPRSQRPLFVDHVHPETYSASDSLDVRKLQLHRRWADCEASMCTWADETDAARQHDADRAVELRAEIRAASRFGDLTEAQQRQLVDLKAAADAAVEVYELLVAELVAEGTSPSHVGNVLDLGNSAVRRIVWRQRPDLKPEGY